MKRHSEDELHELVFQEVEILFMRVGLLVDDKPFWENVELVQIRFRNWNTRFLDKEILGLARGQREHKILSIEVIIDGVAVIWQQLCQAFVWIKLVSDF